MLLQNLCISSYQMIVLEKGQLKIGQTNRSALARVTEQIGATRAAFNIVLEENAMRNDGSAFSDHDIHSYLRSKGFLQPRWRMV